MVGTIVLKGRRDMHDDDLYPHYAATDWSSQLRQSLHRYSPAQTTTVENVE